MPNSKRVLLKQAQRAGRGQVGYVPVTGLIMLDQGHAAATVAPVLGLDASSVYRYAQTRQLQDPVGYLRAEQPGHWGLLASAQLAGLRRELDQALYTDCRAIADWLAATYGVRYSVSALTALTALTALLLEAAEARKAVVYFADAAHPTHNTNATRAWTETGKERPLLTVSGRERVNPNAALNAQCPIQVHFDETDCFSAHSARRLYEKRLIAHPEGPVHVVCDNARYHKNEALTTWLAYQHLVPVFLPPYSPNLSLMERRWKFLCQEIINTTFYRTKDQFKTAVLDFFDRLPEFCQELASCTRLKSHVLNS